MSQRGVTEADALGAGPAVFSASESGALLGSRDWSTTPLGPAARWSAELLAAVRTVLASELPMLIWWGQELVQIYNEAYVPLLGDKHPVALGQPARECWAEVWAEVGPLTESVLAGKGATLSHDAFLFLRRHGYIEETYWTYSYSPIVNGANEVLGIFVATTDVTARVVGERRLSTVHQLGTMPRAGLDSVTDTARAALDIMGLNRPALPFAACYLRNGQDLELAGAYGLVSDTQACPLTIAGHEATAIARVARGCSTFDRSHGWVTLRRARWGLPFRPWRCSAR